MTVRIIEIAEEFTDAPGGRFITDGPFSGEEFRQKFVEPLLKDFDQVILQTNGLYGLPHSFISEVLKLPEKDLERVELWGEWVKDG